MTEQDPFTIQHCTTNTEGPTMTNDQGKDEDETATAPLGHVLPNCTCDGYSTTCPAWAAFVDRFESATWANR